LKQSRLLKQNRLLRQNRHYYRQLNRIRNRWRQIQILSL
ncbi:MAG: hypothetical protein ACI86X_001669, partial [Moritella sp.]